MSAISPNPPAIAFVTTCRGRINHLSTTLPQNIHDNSDYPNARFLVLGYGPDDELMEFLSPTPQLLGDRDRLVVYNHREATTFHVSHAKNMAHRLAILSGVDILVTLDADNFTGPGFAHMIADRFRESGIFMTPDHTYIRTLPHGPLRPCRGFAGRLAIRAQDFIKAGGYNETYDTWRGEDIDLNARMGRMGYTQRFIDNKYLGTIPHNAQVRFKEYPAARQYEQDGAWKISGNENSTVVNGGRFGCGTVYKNFGSDPVELRPIPTRVFGIGLHKTATTSLHRAFQLLGFDSLHWGKGEAPMIWYEMNATGKSQTIDRYYAVCDMPIPLLYKQLDTAYPGSKFILTVRDGDKWLASVERLWNRRYNPTRHLWDVYPISNTLHRALYGRTDFDPIVFMKRYRRHNHEVREYFKNRPNDLLVMNMSTGDGWDKLCPFLGVPQPSVPYPLECVTRDHGSAYDVGGSY